MNEGCHKYSMISSGRAGTTPLVDTLVERFAYVGSQARIRSVVLFEVSVIPDTGAPRVC
jgi:hypothetical protein